MAYLSRRTHMTAYARAKVIVADADKTDSIGNIIRQAVGVAFRGQFVATDKAERDGEVSIDEFVHTTLYLPLLMPVGFMVENEAHLALLSLHMGVMAALTTKKTLHGLVEQMLRRMGGWKLVLVV